jgi:hypothetical protein
MTNLLMLEPCFDALDESKHQEIRGDTQEGSDRLEEDLSWGFLRFTYVE